MKHLLFFLLIIISFNSFGQTNPDNLNGYRFVYVEKLRYQDRGIDNYGLAGRTESFLQNKGFYILNDDNSNWPKQATYNPCEILYVIVENKGRAKVVIEFQNCKGEIVYKDNAHATNWNNNYNDNYRRSLDNIFKRLKKYNLAFNSEKTPKLDYPEVEKTAETEKSLIDYFETHKLDDIEGIYKSYQSPNLSYYKIGIKRKENQYIAIVLESEEFSPWKVGEIKAYFQPSSMKSVFATKWYMANKMSYETFATLENGAILSIEFDNPQTSEKEQSRFIKMFPSATDSAKNKNSSNPVSVTGSGFILNKDGMVVTNAHVIDGAEKIQITINNELGENNYNARVVLKDEVNDVALLKIESSDFKGFNDLPYKISTEAQVGENVFTIGFPLNSIMGKNFKVNNGIISSNTGIFDDIRHYQISVPLQPGNSGGPLFNDRGDVIGITTARLNSEAIGTSIQNVNYAIKSTYILNLINMLPDFKIPTGNSSLGGKDLGEKVKILKNYVCLITTY